MRMGDWSSDVCSSDLLAPARNEGCASQGTSSGVVDEKAALRFGSPHGAAEARYRFMTFRCKDLPVFHALNDGQAKGIVSISMQGRGTGATKGIERNDDRTAHAAWSRGRRRAHRGRSDSDAAAAFRSEEHTSELT